MALTCTTVVIILKGVGEYRRIGLVESICKIYASIMNNRLQVAITFHNALHDFRQGRGAGTATMEAKLAQKIAGLVHEPLFQVFLYVQNPTTPYIEGDALRY